MADDDTNEPTEEFEADDLIDEEVEEPEVELDEEDLDDDDIIDPELDVTTTMWWSTTMPWSTRRMTTRSSMRPARVARSATTTRTMTTRNSSPTTTSRPTSTRSSRTAWSPSRKTTTDEDEEVDVRGDGAERLQPKQQDEQLCPSCFLLVRASAPNCPVGDDDCPIFS